MPPASPRPIRLGPCLLVALVAAAATGCGALVGVDGEWGERGASSTATATASGSGGAGTGGATTGSGTGGQSGTGTSAGGHGGAGTGGGTTSGSGGGGGGVVVGPPGWPKACSTPNGAFGSATAMHSDGTVYAVGVLLGATECGTGPLLLHGLMDSFVARYRADGAIEWARTFGAPASTFARAVVATSDGGVVFAGQFLGGAISFDGEVLDPSDGDGTPTAFVAKLDAKGHVAFAKSLGAGSIHALAVKGDGHLLAVGERHAQANDADALVAELDADGAVVHVDVTSAGGDQRLWSVVALDDGGAIALGVYAGEPSFGGHAPPPSTAESGFGDLVAVRWSSKLEATWARRIGQTGAAKGTTRNAEAMPAGSLAFASKQNPQRVHFAANLSTAASVEVEGVMRDGNADDILLGAIDVTSGTVAWSERLPDAGTSTVGGLAFVYEAAATPTWLTLAATNDVAIDLGAAHHAVAAGGASQIVVASIDAASGAVGGSAAFSDGRLTWTQAASAGTNRLALTGAFHGVIDFPTGQAQGAAEFGDIFVTMLAWPAP